jgi:hypothetical protein
MLGGQGDSLALGSTAPQTQECPREITCGSTAQVEFDMVDPCHSSRPHNLVGAAAARNQIEVSAQLLPQSGTSACQHVSTRHFHGTYCKLMKHSPCPRCSLERSLGRNNLPSPGCGKGKGYCVCQARADLVSDSSVLDNLHPCRRPGSNEKL